MSFGKNMEIIAVITTEHSLKTNFWIIKVNYEWKGQLWNFIKIADMLSVPMQPYSSSFSYSSKSSSKMSMGSFFLSSLALIHSTIVLFDFFCQIPSQPIIIKSSPYLRQLIKSGVEVTICSEGPNVLLFLNYKSPKDLDILRAWLILPPLTNPPAFLMRRYSALSYGLWSKLRGIILPLQHATHLESPALATYMSLSVMKQTLAVHPPIYVHLISWLRLLIFTLKLMMLKISFLPASDFIS